MKKFFKALAVVLLFLGVWSFADNGGSATVLWLLAASAGSYFISSQKLLN